MPTYSFTDKNTKKKYAIDMTMDEHEVFIKKYPHMIQDVCMPAIGDPMRLGRTKHDGKFNDVLKGMKKYYDRADRSAELRKAPGERKKNTINVN
jgi:hypothetical protein